MLVSMLKASFWLSLIAHVRAQDETEDPTTDENLLQFKSRPDLYPPRLFVNLTEDGVTPGYIFMSPYQSFQNSAAIYNTDGTLIWYGFGVTGSGNVHDFRVCRYNGTDHLCFYQGTQYTGYSRGQAVIMNQALEMVGTVTALNGLSSLDQHEFHIRDDSALTIVYHPERYDLSRYNVTGGEGWIQNSIFQDTNLTTGELNFEWSAIEHISLEEGYVNPNQSEVAGTGFNAASPWDYFHMNSVDKNSDGDYLISARHVSALYKISGADGSIIWRCGGKWSDFELLNGLNWSYQHDARWMEHNETTEIISFFDNASNGFNQSADASAGYIIKIDHSADPPTVELLTAFAAPEDIPISSSQGNMQVLNPADWANSNTLCGWGSQPYVTEHDSTGRIIYRANVAADGKMNYRTYKFDIELTPTDSPALYTYALDPDADTTYYMSWNGATQVRGWRIYGRASCEAAWTLVNEVPKTDFETVYTAQGYQEFGLVEAVAEDGTGLRNSTNRGVKTFVPSAGLSANCTGDGCNVVTSYGISTGQEPIQETRGGCPALSVTVLNTTADESGSSNAGAPLGASITSVTSLGLVSSILIGFVL